LEFDLLTLDIHTSYSHRHQHYAALLVSDHISTLVKHSGLAVRVSV